MEQAAHTPPKDVPLKDPKISRCIGKPLKRLDTPDKINGKAIYGIDAMLPGMKFATLAPCPVLGGKIAKVDDSAAKRFPACASGRARRSGRGRRRSYVGCQEGPRGARDQLGRRRRTRRSARKNLGRVARGQQEGRGGRQIRRRHRQGARRRRQVRCVLTSCHSSRTPRWSR